MIYDPNALEWNAEHEVWHVKRTALSTTQQLAVKLIHQSEQFPQDVAEKIGLAIDEDFVTIPMCARAKSGGTDLGWERVLFEWHLDDAGVWLSNSDSGLVVINRDGENVAAAGHELSALK